MKKNILLILAALLFAGLFSVSCAVESYHPYQPVIRPPLEPLCEELKNQIEEDFGLDSFFGHPRARVIEYFGTYNGSVVIMFNEGRFTFSGNTRDGSNLFPLPPVTSLVAGIRFYLDFSVGDIRVWREGQFYFLRNAYDLGLLTKEDIESVAYYFHNGYVKNRELVFMDSLNSSNFDLIIHEPLCENIRTQIRTDHPQAAERPIHYYGTYNGAVAFLLGGLAWAAPLIEVAADIVIVVPHSRMMTIWKEGQFFSLREAYHTGILNRNDLKNIAFYLRQYYGKGGIQ